MSTNGKDADARWVDYVDDVDANAWRDMAGRHSIISRHVDGDDGGDDAAVLATMAVGRTANNRLGWLTALVGVGYFVVWTVLGMGIFPLGVALAGIEMREAMLARTEPMAVGVIVLVAGALQFTTWKAHHLHCCREALGHDRTLRANWGIAWRHGLRLGVHCSYGCVGLTAILLVIGVMDLRAMALVTAANTAERLAPDGQRVARVIGCIVVCAGLFLIARAAAGLG